MQIRSGSFSEQFDFYPILKRAWIEEQASAFSSSPEKAVLSHSEARLERFCMGSHSAQIVVRTRATPSLYPGAEIPGRCRLQECHLEVHGTLWIGAGGKHESKDRRPDRLPTARISPAIRTRKDMDAGEKNKMFGEPGKLKCVCMNHACPLGDVFLDVKRALELRSSQKASASWIWIPAAKISTALFSKTA